MTGAVGIDLGGTKIETQVFDASWAVTDRQRVPTPTDYEALVTAVADQIAWGEEQAGPDASVGISAAGLVSAETGLALTANLAATGHPFPKDIAARAGREVGYFNDCRALTLSEARFGVARGLRAVAGLVIGTGVGGGFVLNGALAEGPAGLGGEFGHMAASAEIVLRHKLPIWTCGCGRTGCFETYLSGPGLSRIAAHLGAGGLSPVDIVSRRDGDGAEAKAWQIWLEMLVSLTETITLACGPDAIVMAGGLSRIEGLAARVQSAVDDRAWAGFRPPRILIAEGGDASGARGAAYAATSNV